MKNMKDSITVIEKEMQIQPVDSYTLIGLWVLVWMRVQSKHGLNIENNKRDDLPVIAF